MSFLPEHQGKPARNYKSGGADPDRKKIAVYDYLPTKEKPEEMQQGNCGKKADGDICKRLHDWSPILKISTMREMTNNDYTSFK